MRTRSVTIKIPEAWWEELRVHAVKHGSSLQAEFSNAIKALHPKLPDTEDPDLGECAVCHARIPAPELPHSKHDIRCKFFRPRVIPPT